MRFSLLLLVFGWRTLYKICNFVSCHLTFFCRFHIICFPFRFADFEFSLQNGKQFTAFSCKFLNKWYYKSVCQPSFGKMWNLFSKRSMFHYLLSMNHHELNQETTMFDMNSLLIPFSRTIINHQSIKIVNSSFSE